MNYKKHILIHYHEISLKGRNRPFFERALLKNIKMSVPESAITRADILFGRIVVGLKGEADEKLIKESVRRVFGVANFSFAFALPSDFEKLAEQTLEILKNKDFTPLEKSRHKRLKSRLLARRSLAGFKTFRVTAKRADKNYPLTSQEVNEKLGALIVRKLGKKVDLENPDLNCFVEIVSDSAFLYFEKEKGPGGLPVGTAGKVLSLLSSGFDSPVASWQLMRRGCRVDFIHFHSYPQTSKESQENVWEIVKVLNQYQFSSKLFLIPFLDIQKEISVKSEDARSRVVLYRRFMMRIAEQIARKENYGALVTGDSLGQVASQTLENIGVISQATIMPIFRPLIGTNKEDIIDTARQIGTYEISARPYDDCCSLFLPEHPETRAKLEVILEIEKKLDEDKLISEAVGGIEVVE